MTGAGFGGCTVSLINKSNVDKVIEKIKVSGQKFYQMKNSQKNLRDIAEFLT
jgi:galactokinase